MKYIYTLYRCTGGALVAAKGSTNPLYFTIVDNWNAS